MINYEFNKELGILETIIEGEVSVQDIADYVISLSNDKSLPKILKVFTDSSKGRFIKGVKPDDLSIIIEANNKFLAEKEKVCTAFIISSSFETAMGQLYKEFSKADNYIFKIFSTKKAACKWLNTF